MSLLDIIPALVLLAFLNERVVEVLLTAFPFLDSISTKTFNTPRILAFVVGTILSVLLNTSILTLFPDAVSFTKVAAYGGYVLTGVVLMGGSGLVHDIIEFVGASKTNAKAA